MERIIITENEQSVEITVSGKTEPQKLNLLKLWLLLWILCGGYVLYEFLFSEYKKNIKLILFVYLIFWVYYLWKMLKVLLYRTKGFEQFIIDSSGFTYIFFDGRKQHKTHLSKDENIKFEYLPDKVNNFTKAMTNSFWNISGKTIGVQRFGKWIEMGIQIPEPEAKQIIKKLNLYYRKIK
ncbi:MAG: hypothetical protein D6707_08245 [Bacteroidetes bacterium]|nr:MAG: hypothetical protein D6707_08245 [Bacteroidota bacterium]